MSFSTDIVKHLNEQNLIVIIIIIIIIIMRDRAERQEGENSWAVLPLPGGKDPIVIIIIIVNGSSSSSSSIHSRSGVAFILRILTR